MRSTCLSGVCGACRATACGTWRWPEQYCLAQAACTGCGAGRARARGEAVADGKARGGRAAHTRRASARPTRATWWATRARWSTGASAAWRAPRACRTRPQARRGRPLRPRRGEPFLCSCGPGRPCHEGRGGAARCLQIVSYVFSDSPQVCWARQPSLHGHYEYGEQGLVNGHGL
jgi:hypothetical protein